MCDLNQCWFRQRKRFSQRFRQRQATNTKRKVQHIFVHSRKLWLKSNPWQKMWVRDVYPHKLTSGFHRALAAFAIRSQQASAPWRDDCQRPESKRAELCITGQPDWSLPSPNFRWDWVCTTPDSRDDRAARRAEQTVSVYSWVLQLQHIRPEASP